MANGMAALKTPGGDLASLRSLHSKWNYTHASSHKMYNRAVIWVDALIRLRIRAAARSVCKLASAIIPREAIHSNEREGRRSGRNNRSIEALMKARFTTKASTAEATFTAILGREACYSAQVIKWDDLLKNGKDYCPESTSGPWTHPPAVLGEDSKYLSHNRAFGTLLTRLTHLTDCQSVHLPHAGVRVFFVIGNVGLGVSNQGPRDSVATFEYVRRDGRIFPQFYAPNRPEVSASLRPPVRRVEELSSIFSDYTPA